MIAKKQFQKLNFDDKFNYLNKILEIFKDSENFLGNFYKIVKKGKEKLNDAFLDELYQFILNILATLDKKKYNEELWKMNKINSKLEQFLEQEKKEKEKDLEGDLKELLNEL